MANETISQNLSQNLDQQKDGRLGDGITHTEQPKALPACRVVVDYGDRLPKRLIEWLARINQRYLVLYQDEPNDTI